MAKIFENPEEMLSMGIAYFEAQDRRKKPYTVSGLALGLGFSNRSTLTVYERRELFAETVQYLKARIEQQMEERLISQGTPTAGLIFTLINNFGWKQKEERTVEHSAPSIEFLIAGKGENKDFNKRLKEKQNEIVES